jgi:hypothetical protein
MARATKSVASKTTTSKTARAAKRSTKKPAAQAPAPPAKRPVWASLYAVCVPLADVSESELAVMRDAPQAAAYPHLQTMQDQFQRVMEILEKEFPGVTALSSPEPIARFNKTQLVTGLPIGVCWADGSQDKAWIGLPECARFFAPAPAPAETPSQETGKPGKPAKQNGGKKKLPPKPEEISDDPQDYEGLTDDQIREFVNGQDAELVAKIKPPKGEINRDKFIPHMAGLVNGALLAEWEAQCAAQ